MARLDATAYGYHIKFQELDSPAMHRLLNDIQERVEKREGFGVLVDLRQPRIFPVAAQEVLKLCIDALMARGMGRQAIILSTPIATLQAQRLSKETGVKDLCRYFEVSSDADWHAHAMAWLLEGTEPGARPAGDS